MLFNQPARKKFFSFLSLNTGESRQCLRRKCAEWFSLPVWSTFEAAGDFKRLLNWAKLATFENTGILKALDESNRKNEGKEKTNFHRFFASLPYPSHFLVPSFATNCNFWAILFSWIFLVIKPLNSFTKYVKSNSPSDLIAESIKLCKYKSLKWKKQIRHQLKKKVQKKKKTSANCRPKNSK